MPDIGPPDGYEADAETAQQEFRQKFAKHFQEHALQRVSHKVGQIQRRLDSLARLLEQDQKCAAVLYNPFTNTIQISSNQIWANSRPENNYIRDIKKLMELVSNHDASMEEIIREPSDLMTKNISKEKRRLVADAKVSQDDLRKLVEEFLIDLMKPGQKTKAWRQHIVQAHQGDRLKTAVAQRVWRLGRDFIKLRRSLLRLTHHDEEASQTLAAISEGRFELVRTGGKKAHAEMRLLSNFLQTHSGQSLPYFGISKLCCPRCGLALKVAVGRARGRHSQIFKEWEFPRFGLPHTRGFLGQEAFEVYSRMPEPVQRGAITFIEGETLKKSVKSRKGSMEPDTSSSDTSFGVGAEELNTSDLTFGEVDCVAEIKERYPEAYHNLFEELGLPPQDLVHIYAASEEKFLALARDEVVSLLQKHDDIDLFDLSRLYNENLELCNCVIEDRAALISNGGFEAAVSFYRHELGAESSSDHHSSDELSELTESLRRGI